MMINCFRRFGGIDLTETLKLTSHLYYNKGHFNDKRQKGFIALYITMFYNAYYV